MVWRRPNSKDTVSDRNSNIRMSLILEKFLGNNFCETPLLKNFAGINFRQSPIVKNFAGINFRESTFSSRVKKGIYFREFGRNSRNFLPAKISSLGKFFYGSH